MTKKANIESIRKNCVNDLKHLLMDGVINPALEGMGKDINANIEAEPNKEVIAKVHTYLHECDIDERDGFALSSGSIQALVNVLKQMDFPRTKGEMNLLLWANIFSNIYV